MFCKKILFCDNSLRDLLNFRGDVIRHFARLGANIILVAPQNCTPPNREPQNCEPQNCEPQNCTPQNRAPQNREPQNREPQNLSWLSQLPNVRFIPVTMNRSGTNPLDDFAYFLALCRIYRIEKPDIIFHYTIKPNIYGTLAARLCKRKCVAMVAGLGYMFTGNSVGKRLGRLMYKVGLRCAHRVMMLNRPNAEKLVGENYVRPQRAILLTGGEGVDLTRFPYVENRFDTVRFLMVARVLYDKGYTEYVEAAAAVKRKYPDTEFGLLGPLDQTSPMAVPKSVVEKDVADGKILYFGQTDDVPAWLSRDGVVVVVVSSYHEGLNRSLMEACAMARPCITTDIAGCRETVEDGVNGYLVPMKDWESLAVAMIRFIELPVEQKRAMAVAGRRLAEERFDIESVIATYGRIIAEI